MLDRLWNTLTSTRFALALFILIALLAVVGTLPGMQAVCHHPAFLGLLGLLGLNTLCCTLRKRKGIGWPVLVVHTGVIITLVGGVVSGFGFVSTVNLYEGDTVDQAYRWDVERDMPLGFAMTLVKINREFYPVPVKVGVLKGAEKVGLYVLKTGEAFAMNGYRVRVDDFDLARQKLRLTVSSNGQTVGSADTEGGGNLPAAFPFRFKLVAYQTPKLKRLWVDLRLASNGQLLADGKSEVNGPLHWNNLSFYNTQTAVDPGGRPYAGIQIVKDPGRPIAFAGFVVTALGAILAFVRRVILH